jgi:hypothetical protein
MATFIFNRRLAEHDGTVTPSVMWIDYIGDITTWLIYFLLKQHWVLFDE